MFDIFLAILKYVLYYTYILNYIEGDGEDMFCSMCGKQSEGAVFCPYCGARMHQEWQPQTAIAPETPELPRNRPKSRIWLFIGIAAGVAAAAAALYFFILVPPIIEGQWYNEDRGEVLVFGSSGDLRLESLCGSVSADYKYDRFSGKGSCSIGGKEYDIKSDGAEIDINGVGVFKKAGGGFDKAVFLDEHGYLGTWYSEERGEVLVFSRGGGLQSKRKAGVTEAGYAYDAEKKTGKITIAPFSYDFEIESGRLNVKKMGVFTQAVFSFDVGGFLSENGDSALGIWHDTNGEGIIDLHADRTYDLKSFGRNLSGTYTQAGNNITITYRYLDLDIEVKYILKDGVLMNNEKTNCDIEEFVRGYSEQKTFDDYYDEPYGLWESDSGKYSLEFYHNGTGRFWSSGNYYNTVYSYEPLGNMGYVNIAGEDTVLFMIFDNTLILLDTVFYKVG